MWIGIVVVVRLTTFSLVLVLVLTLLAFVVVVVFGLVNLHVFELVCEVVLVVVGFWGAPELGVFAGFGELLDQNGGVHIAGDGDFALLGVYVGSENPCQRKRERGTQVQRFVRKGFKVGRKIGGGGWLVKEKNK